MESHALFPVFFFWPFGQVGVRRPSMKQLPFDTLCIQRWPIGLVGLLTQPHFLRSVNKKIANAFLIDILRSYLIAHQRFGQQRMWSSTRWKVSQVRRRSHPCKPLQAYQLLQTHRHHMTNDRKANRAWIATYETIPRAIIVNVKNHATRSTMALPQIKRHHRCKRFQLTYDHLGVTNEQPLNLCSLKHNWKSLNHMALSIQKNTA